MRLLTACLLCALALPAAAQIYSYTDAKGNRVYTNQPPEGQAVETVELAPVNSIAEQPPATHGATAKKLDGPPYQRLAITDLPDQGAIRANDGNFSVGALSEPALQPGHQLRLLLDGQPAATGRPPFQLLNVERGQHLLQLEVLSASGQVLQRSASLTITVQRISLNSPARAH